MKFFSKILLISVIYFANSSSNVFFGKKKIKDFPFKFGKININPRHLNESNTSTIPSGEISETSSDNTTNKATDNTTDKATDNTTDKATDNITDKATDKSTNKATENKEGNSTLTENLLLGFDNYKYNNSILSFFAHVKYYVPFVRKDTINFLLKVAKRNLRNLEDDEIDFICDLDSCPNACKYYCNGNMTGALSNVEVILNETDITPTKYALITGKNLQNQRENLIGNDFVIINDCNKTNETDQKISITGSSEGKINNSTVTLYVITNNNKSIPVQGQIKSDDSKVEITLIPKRSVAADINNTIGVIKDNKGSIDKTIYLQFDKDANSSINFASESYPSIRGNSRGMSAGAIVGIILPCFAALLGVTAIAYFFGKKRPDLPPSQNIANNTIGVNSSTNIVN